MRASFLPEISLSMFWFVTLNLCLLRALLATARRRWLGEPFVRTAPMLNILTDYQPAYEGQGDDASARRASAGRWAGATPSGRTCCSVYSAETAGAWLAAAPSWSSVPAAGSSDSSPGVARPHHRRRRGGGHVDRRQHRAALAGSRGSAAARRAPRLEPAQRGRGAAARQGVVRSHSRQSGVLHPCFHP